MLTSTALLAACAVQGPAPAAGQVEQDARISGAIFTTTVDGSRVNANIYDAKEDVYLDGGPGEHAPPGAAGLPEGNYYFQVTNPNGQVLLSSDAIECRSVHVNASGVIDAVNRATTNCEHQTGIDRDHAELGAITVQLMPYANTPNPGGEYKAWMTPVDLYDVTYTRTHGFVPQDSKTDNFKIRIHVLPPPPPPPPTPVCGNGVVEQGEQCDDGASNGAPGDDCDANCQLVCAHPQS